ncbi:NHLP-related RiPP peptide [Pseudoxanthomonas sacheonensis]|uniref:Modified peptide n=1 Tax=Pseudoxanthomonas sacheonensis TaxID=443615 RepID=A0ABU1RTD6_9GAMM|nr:NHLP-related RiPP peptide [Pseudoxanthomonas sacheonensis]MDR6842027.1 putative modified peptide [Pseudoxanthomonas sacheonensis]
MATKKTGASGKAAPLDPKVAGKLLDKLSTDNEFRRLFKKDPKAALSSVGYKEPQGGTGLKRIYDCCKIDRIAPKAAIVEARAALLDSMTKGLGQSPIQLNVASSAERRTRK